MPSPRPAASRRMERGSRRSSQEQRGQERRPQAHSRLLRRHSRTPGQAAVVSVVRCLKRVDCGEGDGSDKPSALHGDAPASGLRHLDVRGELVAWRDARVAAREMTRFVESFAGDQECRACTVALGCPEHLWVDRAVLHGGEDPSAENVLLRPGRPAIQEEMSVERSAWGGRNPRDRPQAAPRAGVGGKVHVTHGTSCPVCAVRSRRAPESDKREQRCGEDCRESAALDESLRNHPDGIVAQTSGAVE